MFHFVANLKPYTLHAGPGVRRFRSYLLSVDYYREFSKLARVVNRERRILGRRQRERWTYP